MNSPYLYVRTLRQVDFSVFNVQDGQKTYYDSQFGRSVPYSSGQQTKRSILELLSAELGAAPAPTTFVLRVSKPGKDGKRSLGEGEPLSACDPTYPDQLLGGYMRAGKGGGERTVKRRSPLSISAMRLLHPLLGGIAKENITFDRSDKPHDTIIRVLDENERVMSEEEVLALLGDKDRSLYRKWIPENARATGLYVHDVAIDLRTLFCVTTNQFEPELSREMVGKLRDNGWADAQNAFGQCLVCPAAQREDMARALAKALLNWRIYTNQARTFSPMPMLAVAVSANANVIANAIRAQLSEDNERKAVPIVEDLPGARLFVSPAAEGYVRTQLASPAALEAAEAHIAEVLLAYPYESQPLAARPAA